MKATGSSTERTIWNFLIVKGLSPAGAAGLMGNLYAESGLDPQNLQNSYEKRLGFTNATYTAAVDSGSYSNFVRDSAGYGLAQWTYWSRKEALLNFARKTGASIGSLEMQLDFMIQELKGYVAVWEVLRTARTVKEASDIVLTKYERPADMGSSVKAKRASYGQAYFDAYAKTDTDTEKEATTMSAKITTAAQLAQRALDVAKNFKTLYVMGCFGAPMNATNKTRYCNNHDYNRDPTRQAMIKAASADTFGFDCVCLIKGLLWGWTGDASKVYGGAGYACNGVPDIGADSMIRVCHDISTDFSHLEVGEAVWMSGHIGIYVGGGLAVECTPKWENCVQVTACNCSVAGYNRRNWTKHGKLPYVSYTGQDTANGPAEEPAAPSKPNTTGELKVGDVVNFTGFRHYASANAGTGPNCKPGMAKVTALYPSGKHPVHLIAVSGGGSSVYGWVDTADIEGSAQAELWTPAVGDVVNFTGSRHYASANASKGPACSPGRAKITQIYKPGKSKHPYHLIGDTVYGWVDAGTFTKA